MAGNHRADDDNPDKKKAGDHRAQSQKTGKKKKKAKKR